MENRMHAILNDIQNEIQEEIASGINNVNKRIEWNINSECLIYSRTDNKWFSANIINIFINEETNQEWLTVEYKKKNTKKIQRFSKDIKPIDLNDTNHKIIEYILKKLKHNYQNELDNNIHKQVTENNKTTKQLDVIPTTDEQKIKEQKENVEITVKEHCDHLTLFQSETDIAQVISEHDELPTLGDDHTKSLSGNIAIESIDIDNKSTHERQTIEITQLKNENEQLKQENKKLTHKLQKLKKKKNNNKIKEKYKKKYRAKVKQNKKEKIELQQKLDEAGVVIEVKWQWQNDNYEWIDYSKDISNNIEKLPVGQLYSFTLNNNNMTYEIAKYTNETGMQRNIDTNTTRNCIRISNAITRNYMYPDWWNMKFIDDDNYYNKPQLIELDLLSEIGSRVMKQFNKTVKNRTVLKIESVENQMLYDKYCNEKQTLSKLMGENKLNEKWLFHGTSTQQVMNSIQQQGFRKEFNTRAAFGNGTYFARDALYSIRYASSDNNGTFKMFQCKVICGESIRGYEKYELRKWPKQDNGLIYDTLVDNWYDPSIFVIHENARAYPMFVVTFQ